MQKKEVAKKPFHAIAIIESISSVWVYFIIKLTLSSLTSFILSIFERLLSGFTFDGLASLNLTTADIRVLNFLFLSQENSF